MEIDSTGRVLFVCRANVCRSPMAEAIFNALARDAGIEARAGSAGVAALENRTLDPNARTALEELGVYPGDHRGRQVNRAIVEQADLVLTMSPRQREELVEGFEASSRAVDTLPTYAGGVPGRDRIVDPHGRTMQSYRSTCREILEYVGLVVDRLARTPHRLHQ